MHSLSYFLLTVFISHCPVSFWSERGWRSHCPGCWWMFLGRELLRTTFLLRTGMSWCAADSPLVVTSKKMRERLSQTEICYGRILNVSRICFSASLLVFTSETSWNQTVFILLFFMSSLKKTVIINKHLYV